MSESDPRPVRSPLLAAYLAVPRSRSRRESRAVVRDVADETDLEMLLRRLREAQQRPSVEALTDGHLKALLSR